MRSELRRALRGICSAVSLLSFVGLFLAVEARLASWALILGLGALGVTSLAAAGGRPALRRLLGRDRTTDEDALDDDTDAERQDAWLDGTADQTPWTDRADRADRASDDPETDWSLARLEPALDDSWNRWSDAALTVGLATLGVGSLALLATYPGEDPPLGLVLVVLFGFNGALITLPFVFRDEEE